MNRWMKRRIERSRARCEKAEEQSKKSVGHSTRNLNTNETRLRFANLTRLPQHSR